MRKQKGITLIALVITIVVLLILAAVSITALTDEDKGVVTKAKKSAQLTEDAAEQEDQDIAEIMNYAETEIGADRTISTQVTQTPSSDNFDTVVTLDVDIAEDFTLTLEQKRELVAFMFDFESYEDLLTFAEENAGEALASMEESFEGEEEMLDHIIMMMADTLDFSQIEKIEYLGVPVISVKTPYGNTLYTTPLSGTINCGFAKNGTYKFVIKCGNSSKTETVTISNLMEKSASGTHKVKIGSARNVNYMLDSNTTVLSGERIVEVSSSLTPVYVASCPRLQYVKVNETFYKYFESVEEWDAWFYDAYNVPYYLAAIAKSLGFTSVRQTYVYLSGAGASFMNNEYTYKYKLIDCADIILEGLNNGTIEEAYPVIYHSEDWPTEVLNKCPQYKLYNEEWKSTGFTPISITEDTHIYMHASACLTVDMYVEVEIWDEEKKKKIRIRKKIKDVTYDDDLVVWDFDKGEFTTAKPLWIMRPKVSTEYNLLKFSDGSELKTIYQHRIFNKEAGKFTYPMTDETPIGTTTYTADGKEVKLVSKEVVSVPEVEYVNIITKYHINVFANNILTSCRFSNLYPIKDMKYVKDDRELADKSEFENIPEEYVEGLRLAEQPRNVNNGNDVVFADTLEEHIKNLIDAAKEKDTI